MPNKKAMDSMYMDIAYRIAKMSKAVKKQVGAVIVKDNNIVSFGWNGMPHGFDNCCEYTDEEGRLKTKSEVVHAEMNAISKAAKGVIPIDGATIYITYSPCWNCAGAIISSGISRVVYDDEWEDDSINYVKKANVKIEKIKNYEGLDQS